MSQWHRANPDLCGTDADPSMLNEPYRLARDELLREGLIYAAVQGDGYRCDRCASVIAIDTEAGQIREDAERLGIDLGPPLCDACFEAQA